MLSPQKSWSACLVFAVLVAAASKGYLKAMAQNVNRLKPKLKSRDCERIAKPNTRIAKVAVWYSGAIGTRQPLQSL